jgi:hypothetical protein
MHFARNSPSEYTLAGGGLREMAHLQCCLLRAAVHACVSERAALSLRVSWQFGGPSDPPAKKRWAGVLVLPAGRRTTYRYRRKEGDRLQFVGARPALWGFKIQRSVFPGGDVATMQAGDRSASELMLIEV